MIDDLKSFYNTYTKGETYETPSKEIINEYKGKLPDIILQLWEKDGWCSYGNGFFWTFNPELYSDLINKWIDSSPPIIPFLNSAFGDIFFWNGEEDFFQYLNVRYNLLDYVTEEFELFFNIYLGTEEFSDKLNKELFEKVLERYSKLNPHECYGFTPILALGGSEDLEIIQIVGLKEYLLLNSQAVGEPDYYE